MKKSQKLSSIYSRFSVRIFIGFGLLYGVHALCANTVSIEADPKLVLELKSEKEIRNTEIKSRREFFESLEKLPQAEQNVAIERWRNEEAAREALRVKSPEEIAFESKTEAELDAEARAHRKASLERQIAHLEKSVAEKQSLASDISDIKRVSGKLDVGIISKDIVVEKSSEVLAEESILAELDELSLKRAKAELSAMDLPMERQTELSTIWSGSADGKRMLELQQALHEISEAEHIAEMKKSIATLKMSLVQRSLDAGTREANELRLKHLEMRLSNAEFNKAFEQLPEDSKASAITAHRVKQDRLQAEIEKADAVQKLSGEPMEKL